MTTKPIHKTEERLIAQARKDVGTMMAAIGAKEKDQ